MRDRHPADRWPASRQLWTMLIGCALFDLVLTIATSAFVAGPSVARGQDFMAFYSAGRLAADGRAAEMYNMPTLAAFQQSIASDAGYVAPKLAPWLNPPHAALVFVPLASLGFRAALLAWTCLSLACLATSAIVLSRIIGETSDRWRHRGLIFACAFLSTPTMLSLGHGQNAPLSLLLLTLAVAAWRAGRPIAAGVACCALAYKPHLAAIVAVGCVASLGPRVLLGLAIGGATTLAATLALLPGALSAFVTRMPANAHSIFVEHGFNWQRHVTFFGFTRHLFHGNGPGENAAWIGWLTAALVASATLALLFAWWRLRPSLDAAGAAGVVARDRLIVAALLATPLIVPYFVDYDLLLPLCVGGAIVGRELLMRGDAPALRRVAMVTYAWLVVNAVAAVLIGISLTTPLLATLFALHVARCARREERSIAATRAIVAETRVRLAA